MRVVRVCLSTSNILWSASEFGLNRCMYRQLGSNTRSAQRAPLKTTITILNPAEDEKKWIRLRDGVSLQGGPRASWMKAPACAVFGFSKTRLRASAPPRLRGALHRPQTSDLQPYLRETRRKLLVALAHPLAFQVRQMTAVSHRMSYQTRSRASDRLRGQGPKS